MIYMKKEMYIKYITKYNDNVYVYIICKYVYI